MKPAVSGEPEPRISTGNSGLDAMLEGGLIPRRPYLIVGPAGTGKTTLALQFLCEGVRRGERTLMVTLEEPPNEARLNHRGLGDELERVEVFDAIPDVMRYERVPFKDISAVRSAVPFSRVPYVIRRTPELTGVEVTITGLEQMLRSEVARRGYSRVVVDSLTALQYFCMKGFNEVAGAQTFLRFLSDLQVTTLLTVESPLEDVDTTERILARGEVRLFRWELDGATVRAIGVEKFRGGSHDVRLHPYRIGPRGLDINVTVTISRDTRQIIEPEPIVTILEAVAPVGAAASPLDPLTDEVRDLVLVGADLAPLRETVEAAIAAVAADDREAAASQIARASALAMDLAGAYRGAGVPATPEAADAMRRVVARTEASRGGVAPTTLPPTPELTRQLEQVRAVLGPVAPPPAAAPAPLPPVAAAPPPAPPVVAAAPPPPIVVPPPAPVSATPPPEPVAPAAAPPPPSDVPEVGPEEPAGPPATLEAEALVATATSEPEGEETATTTPEEGDASTSAETSEVAPVEAAAAEADVEVVVAETVPSPVTAEARSAAPLASPAPPSVPLEPPASPPPAVEVPSGPPPPFPTRVAVAPRSPPPPPAPATAAAPPPPRRPPPPEPPRIPSALGSAASGRATPRPAPTVSRNSGPSPDPRGGGTPARAVPQPPLPVTHAPALPGTAPPAPVVPAPAAPVSPATTPSVAAPAAPPAPAATGEPPRPEDVPAKRKSKRAPRGGRKAPARVDATAAAPPSLPTGPPEMPETEPPAPPKARRRAVRKRKAPTVISAIPGGIPPGVLGTAGGPPSGDEPPPSEGE